MSDQTSPEAGRFHPQNILDVNKSPLQRPGGDELIRTAVLAGPEKGGDRRLYISREVASLFLDKARASPLFRSVMFGVGIRVDLYRQKDGHQYEVWSVIGHEPIPEPLPTVFGGKGI